MDVETSPPQPDEVERAIAGALDEPAEGDVDPWWRAGIEEALGE
ncbi:MAG TPA: hypothetical protein VGC78_11385 [Gaiellaceae bacterium]